MRPRSRSAGAGADATGLKLAGNLRIGGDDTVIDEALHEDYRNHSFLAHGRDSMKGVIGDFRGAFPDSDGLLADNWVVLDLGALVER